MAFQTESFPKVRGRKVVIGIDIGTTLGTVAYTVQHPDQSADQITTANVRTVSGYPGDKAGRGDQEELPMLSFYNVKSGPAVEKHVWGFEAKNLLEYPSGPIHSHGVGYVTRPKLLFDDSPVTDKIRIRIADKIRTLMQIGMISKAEDILQDILDPWMTVVRKRLLTSSDLLPEDKPEFVICVPTHWSVSSHHKLCKAMETSIRAAWPAFRSLEPSHSQEPIDIFTVREPEAGANGIFGQGFSQIRVCLFTHFMAHN